MCSPPPSSPSVTLISDCFIKPKSIPEESNQSLYLSSWDLAAPVPNTSKKRHEAPKLRERFFHFSAGSLAKLKAKANAECNTTKISTLQALSAHVWRCIIRARNCPPDQETSCRMAINDRQTLNPPLPVDYVGNSWKLYQAVQNHTDQHYDGKFSKFHCILDLKVEEFLPHHVLSFSLSWNSMKSEITMSAQTKAPADMKCYRKDEANRFHLADFIQLICHPVEPEKELSCYLYLSNMMEDLVAFQFRDLHAINLWVKPISGIILPHTTCGITVKMQAQKDPPPDMKCKDKLRIQCVVLTQLPTDDIKQMFNEGKPQHYVEEHELPVIYLSRPLPISPLPKEAYSLLSRSRISNFDEISTMELLKIDKHELNFPFEAKKQISCSLQLSNMTGNHVAFKVSTTHQKNFSVRPNKGVVLPRSTCNVLVTRQAQKSLPDVLSKEKFLIQSALVKPGSTEDISWKTLKDAGIVRESKLTVVYTPANESPFLDAEGSKDKESDDLNVHKVVPDSCVIYQMSAMELLKIDKQELNFPFEANKRISCPLQLSNLTENHVAFKVKTTQPKKCIVQPNKGVVPPRSTCDVLVTMQAQKAIPEVQSRTKFLIQSAVVKPCTSVEDVKWEMLKDAVLLKEYKLPAVYTPSTETPFEDAEGSRECISGPSRLAVDETKDEGKVRSIIQRKLRRISSAFEKMFNSLGITSRLWIFRNSSSAYQRLLDESDDEH
ncbi:OLC1v1031848C1 [Oldenlandia corymbosa var. corymbosa]|uniref:OLC1v1031848C1 n=1 Tax=Oldenlandia corymbosa var. corymbosa TaxID=529605 RepID=A0AAV1CK96_OLDCO|nr:OLC1v1031848C1 [Oldenlandia corymbosa var. corymbosa]